jgi:hypothetical protein
MCRELKGKKFADRKKLYMEDRTKAEFNMEKLVECKTSKSQTRERQFILRSVALQIKRSNDCSFQRWQRGRRMSLLLQTIVRGPKRLRMGLLRSLLNMDTHTHTQRNCR